MTWNKVKYSETWLLWEPPPGATPRGAPVYIFQSKFDILEYGFWDICWISQCIPTMCLRWSFWIWLLRSCLMLGVLTGKLYIWHLGIFTAGHATWFYCVRHLVIVYWSACWMVYCTNGFWGSLLLGMRSGLLMVCLMGIWAARYANWFVPYMASGDFYCSGC